MRLIRDLRGAMSHTGWKHEVSGEAVVFRAPEGCGHEAASAG